MTTCQDCDEPVEKHARWGDRMQLAKFSQRQEFSRVFALTTSFINHAPTFDALSQLVITTDSHEQNIT
eukprot:768650-Hanusia_phi.AAC.7